MPTKKRASSSILDLVTNKVLYIGRTIAVNGAGMFPSYRGTIKDIELKSQTIIFITSPVDGDTSMEKIAPREKGSNKKATTKPNPPFSISANYGLLAASPGDGTVIIQARREELSMSAIIFPPDNEDSESQLADHH